jgi:glycosyltransferase involved in cell wall biosynthesis
LLKTIPPDRDFPDLPVPDGALESGARRIAIASLDFAGPFQGSGSGTGYRGLAEALAGAGHQVTVLYLHPSFHRGTAAEWTEYFRNRGIEFVHVTVPGEIGWYGEHKQASLQCYRWLRDQPGFDVIHFCESSGLPYYSLVAKKSRLAFQNTTLCVTAHGSHRWSRIGNESLLSRAEDVVLDYMERKSIELADVLVSPSQHLLKWMRDDGWALPDDSYVANNVLPGVEPAQRYTDNQAIQELVFFGRLDRRKGVPFFCDVVDRLRRNHQFVVTFLGPDAIVDARPSADYIRIRAGSWTPTPRVLTSWDRSEALEYLRGAGRLAVIPSQLDSSPCTLQECLELGIPFLASDRGGIPELIHPDDRQHATAPLDVALFASRLDEILRSGQRCARIAPHVPLARDRWDAWHRSVAPVHTPSPTAPCDPPLISICIAHFERPHLLERMIASLRTQTHSQFEVVVVDDGSQSEAARSYLSALETEFASRGWQVLRQQNAGPGVARDCAVRAARGSYVLFADDDDELRPETVETFARVAQHTGADAFSCVLMEFEGSVPPDLSSGAYRLLIPLGPALAPGLIYPEFGGTVYMLRRDCYFAVGGFPAERDVDEDWELMLKVVAHGFQLQVIPEALVWYRKQAESRSRADNRFKRNASRIRIYEKMLPIELRDLAALAFVRLSHVTDAGAQRRVERVIAQLERLHRLRQTGQLPATSSIETS